jgi:hypothetical protein
VKLGLQFGSEKNKLCNPKDPPNSDPPNSWRQITLWIFVLFPMPSVMRKLKGTLLLGAALVRTAQMVGGSVRAYFKISFNLKWRRHHRLQIERRTFAAILFVVNL